MQRRSTCQPSQLLQLHPGLFHEYTWHQPDQVHMSLMQRLTHLCFVGIRKELDLGFKTESTSKVNHMDR